MELFRELTHDDPHRRSARGRSASATKDEGDLFTLRPSPRKMRILLDIESFGEADSNIDKLLDGFLSYPHLESVSIKMSEATLPDPGHDDDDQQGFVVVRDVTRHKGDFAYPGPNYGWRIKGERLRWDGSATLDAQGSIAPQPQLFEALRAYLHEFTDEQRRSMTQEDVERTVLLSEVARAIDYDVVISETVTTGRRDLPPNNRANIVSRADAVAVIAHYMRRQQKYIIDPVGRGTMNRRGYYMETVAALAPGIWHWLAKCQLSSEIYASSHRYLADCHALIGRLSRALKARDELIASIGALQTEDVIDDGADALDHVLISLCGAVDVIARSLHAALQLEGKERNAKLHIGGGYRKLLDELYAGTSGRDKLDRLQKRLDVVFRLRNSIHSRTLEAVGSVDFDPNRGASVNVGRLDIFVPDETVESLKNPDGGGMAFWGARQLATTPLVVADLSHLLNAVFDSVLSFIDQLCRIMAAEWTMSRDPILRLDVLSAESTLGPKCAKDLRILVGMPKDGDVIPFPADSADEVA